MWILSMNIPKKKEWLSLKEDFRPYKAEPYRLHESPTCTVAPVYVIQLLQSTDKARAHTSDTKTPARLSQQHMSHRAHTINMIAKGMLVIPEISAINL